MEISMQRFEQALQKISPEMASTMMSIFNMRRKHLQDNIASPLVEQKFKKTFNSTINNLESVKRFVVEEAEKPGKKDSEAIVKKYFELLKEIGNSSEYLFSSAQDRTIDNMVKDLDELKVEVDKLIKKTDTYEPSKKEIDEVLKTIDGGGKKLKVEVDKPTKGTSTYEPSQKEIDEILEIIDGGGKK